MKVMGKVTRLMIALISIVAAACSGNDTPNNMFGVWRIDSYEINDSVQSGLCDSTTFSFQSNIVNVVVLVDEYQTYYSSIGTWNIDGNKFLLNFTHHDNQNEPGTSIYAAPTWLGMSSDTIMVMDIVSHNTAKMTLKWLAPDDKTRTYKLHKNF